jgi:lipopolysaccharide export system ATP-binding protein
MNIKSISSFLSNSLSLKKFDRKNRYEAKLNTESTLKTEGLSKVYKKKTVVKGVDIQISQGEVVGLLGPNGAGKTTSFYMMVGLVKPENGRVFIDDLEVTDLPMYLRARLGIGYLAQEPSIFRKLTVRQNLEAILEMMDYSKSEMASRVESLLADLDISHVQDQMGYTLSGGERRRAEIARALVIRPKFLLLDEPFAGVDPIAVNDIQSVITDLKKNNIGVLITDHNVRETLKITDRAYIMYSGEVLRKGTSEELINDPEARRIYLGEDFRM